MKPTPAEALKYFEAVLLVQQTQWATNRRPPNSVETRQTQLLEVAVEALRAQVEAKR